MRFNPNFSLHLVDFLYGTVLLLVYSSMVETNVYFIVLRTRLHNRPLT